VFPALPINLQHSFCTRPTHIAETTAGSIVPSCSCVVCLLQQLFILLLFVLFQDYHTKRTFVLFYNTEKTFSHSYWLLSALISHYKGCFQQRLLAPSDMTMCVLEAHSNVPCPSKTPYRSVERCILLCRTPENVHCPLTKSCCWNVISKGFFHSRFLYFGVESITTARTISCHNDEKQSMLNDFSKMQDHQSITTQVPSRNVDRF